MKRSRRADPNLHQYQPRRLDYRRRSVLLKISSIVENQLNYRFSIRRLIAGSALTAVPFALLTSYGGAGSALASGIAVCILLIALLAKDYQLRALIRIVIAGLVGWSVGLLFTPPLYRPIERAQFTIVTASIGIVFGTIWAFPSYCEYNSRSRKTGRWHRGSSKAGVGED